MGLGFVRNAAHDQLLVCLGLFLVRGIVAQSGRGTAFSCNSVTSSLRDCVVGGMNKGVACTKTTEGQLVQTLASIGLPCISTSECMSGVCGTYQAASSANYCYSVAPQNCSGGASSVTISHPSPPPGNPNYWFRRTAQGTLTVSKPITGSVAEALIEGRTSTLVTLSQIATTPQVKYSIAVDCATSVKPLDCFNNVKTYIQKDWAAQYSKQTGQDVALLSIEVLYSG